MVNPCTYELNLYIVLGPFKYAIEYILDSHRIFKFISVAPRIDRRNLRDVTISAGSALKFDANIIGEPPPTVEWRLGAVPLRCV